MKAILRSKFDDVQQKRQVWDYDDCNYPPQTERFCETTGGSGSDEVYTVYDPRYCHLFLGEVGEVGEVLIVPDGNGKPT